VPLAYRVKPRRGLLYAEPVFSNSSAKNSSLPQMCPRVEVVLWGAAEPLLTSDLVIPPAVRGVAAVGSQL
jgi:hypothetical protein